MARHKKYKSRANKALEVEQARHADTLATLNQVTQQRDGAVMNVEKMNGDLRAMINRAEMAEKSANNANQSTNMLHDEIRVLRDMLSRLTHGGTHILSLHRV